MNKKARMIWRGLAHPIKALRFSLDGLVSTMRDEIAFRHELILGAVHLLAVFWVEMPLGARLCLALAWFLLVAAELLNTAIEALTDKVSPEWNVLAKRAKDCGSAAVACVLAGLFVLWACVIASKVM